MASETPVALKPDQISYSALHEEIKRRAYQLYEQRGQLGRDYKHQLEAELPRLLYAAFELEKDTGGESRDLRSVRAARVYLRALRSCLEESWGQDRSSS